MTTPLQVSTPELGGRRALTLALMALIFTFMLPAAGLALSVFGFVVGVRDARLLGRAKQRTGMAVSAIVISVIAFLLGAVTTLVQVYFSAELTAYAECRKGAGTVTAEQECTGALKRALESKLGVPWPSDMPLPG
ncbi:hypothetical protein GCM10009555_106750 [Acrocarpospora macrocephala]|uniref:DUF4190 domain-containing protein n=1 Tax=Acrocarpospora macrocephala TaxID=150177 RepID=A0A5M3X5K1_9ACTN|nr:hypothetical protein [Acrocarpospora macrocephala]GES15419.1 hypothetical protein Amac_090160 [Acrocarpospora macrocephala]